jgi:hypothetical protein
MYIYKPKFSFTSPCHFSPFSFLYNWHLLKLTDTILEMCIRKKKRRKHTNPIDQNIPSRPISHALCNTICSRELD